MRYFKNIENKYIVSISTVHGQTEISEAEYNDLMSMIRTAPLAPEGYAYMLLAGILEWELVKLPAPEPEPEPEAEISDYEQELTDLGVRFG